jgi:hypothetical protein
VKLTGRGVPELLIVCGLSALIAAIGVSAAASALKPDRTSLFSAGLGFSATHAVTILAVPAGLLLFRLRGLHARIGFAAFAAALTLAVGGLGLDATFAPPSTFGVQFEQYYGPTGNLNYGEQLAANLREGHGFRYDNGSVETYRMPGYPALIALSSAIARVAPRDWRGVDAVTIWMQLFLTALAVALLAAVAVPRFKRLTLLLVVTTLALLPAGIELTQVDSVMYAAGLLATAALLPFLDRARGDGARWVDVILLHLAFGFYYVLRTDVAIAWAAVTVIVHRRRWRPYLVWLAVFVGIGAGFGAYTATHGNEFTFGTNNTGHVAFVGLWQIPHDRFIWQPTDRSYDLWISAHGKQYRRPGANAFAEREIARFYATFPGYVTTLAIDKGFTYFDSETAQGSTPYRIAAELRRRFSSGGAWLLLMAIVLALAAGYRRYRTALLAWGALFVLPLFFLVQQEGRFTYFPTGSLAIAGIWLLLEPGFYRAIARRWVLTVPLGAALLLVWAAHNRIDSHLLRWDAFRYWTPVLSAHGSTLVLPATGVQLRPASEPGKCLDVTGDSTDDGTPIQVWPCLRGRVNQAWSAVDAGSGAVELKARISGLASCLTLPDTPGPIEELRCAGLDTQRWRLVPAGGGLDRIRGSDGRCLVVAPPGGRGAHLALAPCSANGTRWRLRQVSFWG